MQVGKGLVRSLHLDPRVVVDLVPVDFPVNTMITAAWFTAVHKPAHAQIYHITTGSTNPVHWAQMGK